MEQKTKRREWVKTAAIVFLSVLLILTFFSNTIMNRSLPEVATQVVQSGSINAQIRGSGTISAEETYDVTISQSRKVQSVKARVGDEVKTGDVLFVLDPAESSELQAARDTLASMELAYQQSLISASNAAAQENRNIQKLREAYNEALENYRFYSNVDPSRIKSLLVSAEASQKTLDKEKSEASKAVLDAKSDKDYLANQEYLQEIKSEQESIKSKLEEEKDKKAKNEELLNKQNSQEVFQNLIYEKLQEIREKEEELTNANNAVATAEAALKNAINLYGERYNELKAYVVEDPSYTSEKTLALMEVYVREGNEQTLKNAMLRAGIVEENISNDDYTSLRTAFWEITEATNSFEQEQLNRSAIEGSLSELQSEYEELIQSKDATEELTKQIEESEKKILQYERDYSANASKYNAVQMAINAVENRIELLEESEERIQQRIDDLQDYISNLNDAQSAAATLNSAKEALEDATFALSLGDTEALSLQNDKEKIEKQKALIAELEEKSDAVEVKARVSGVISAVNITAGNTANAETPLATITIKDRGYTVQISCTADQSRRVTIGDQAKLSNYYSGSVTATLERIIPDPQNPQTGRYLVFRLTGEGVQPGSNVTLAIGQKSATYEALIPNSALRSDTNGNYVLVVVEKSNALTTRYTARRVDVNVLASDDTQTAVVGLSPGDFVITTANRPIEAGAQVRLPDAS